MPNAIILHHPLLTVGFGNLTEQKEKVRDMEEWWKLLAAPVAAKMGISLDEFIKRMYQNPSTGNWEEFADHARAAIRPSRAPRYGSESCF